MQVAFGREFREDETLGRATIFATPLKLDIGGKDERKLKGRKEDLYFA